MMPDEVGDLRHLAIRAEDVRADLLARRRVEDIGLRAHPATAAEPVDLGELSGRVVLILIRLLQGAAHRVIDLVEAQLACCIEGFPRFADLLALEPDVSMFARLRAAESIGRPLGDDRFLARIERLTSRSLKPRKPGPKPQLQV
jgi:hypothetical protein